MKITTQVVVDTWKQMVAAGAIVSCERVAIELEEKGFPRIRRQNIRYHLLKTEEGKELLKTAKPIRHYDRQPRTT